MAALTYQNVSYSRFVLFRWKKWAFDIYGWQRTVHPDEVDVHLLPTLKLVYRKCDLQRGPIRMVKLEADWGIWIGYVSVIHGFNKRRNED